MVKESKLKLHNTYKISESIHLNILKYTDMEFVPTSKKIIILNSITINIELVDINCAPVLPIFLPKNPAVIELSIGNNINDRYIYITYSNIIYIIITFKLQFK
jgi:hypothetical protein